VTNEVISVRQPLGVIIIGFSLLIALGILMNQYIKDSATELTQHLEKISNYLDNGQWEQAKEELHAIDATWGKTQKYWSILLNHEEIETIDERLNCLGQYIEHQSLILAKGELALLHSLVKHVYDTETFSLVNLL